MKPKTCRPALAALVRSSRLGAAAIALALSGCVPIPIMENAYVPDKSDVEAATTYGSGCAFNEAMTTGTRRVGNVRISARLYRPNDGAPEARMFLRLNFNQATASGGFQSIAVNPARVSLQENGRSNSARLEERETHVNKGGARSITSVRLVFPAPTAISREVKVVFGAGAIRIGGRAVNFAPIRFHLKQSPAIYMFPCIPA